MGFTCIHGGWHDVYVTADHNLAVKCRSGHHYLHGQLLEDGTLTGVFVKTESSE